MKLVSGMYLVILKVLFTRDFIFLPFMSVEIASFPTPSAQLLFYQCLLCLPVAEDSEAFKTVCGITVLALKGTAGKDFI